MNNRAHSQPQISVVKAAIAQLQQGRFVVVADDANRENEGDLIALADRMTPQSMAFMVRQTSGVVCVAMSGERLDELGIPLMVANNTDNQTTAFTVTVDYIPGTTTGISAHDRSATVRALGNNHSTAEQFSRPGHISRSAPARKVCSNAVGTPKPPSIWRVCVAQAQWQPSPNSCTTMAR